MTDGASRCRERLDLPFCNHPQNTTRTWFSGRSYRIETRKAWRNSKDCSDDDSVAELDGKPLHGHERPSDRAGSQLRERSRDRPDRVWAHHLVVLVLDDVAVPHEQPLHVEPSSHPGDLARIGDHGVLESGLPDLGRANGPSGQVVGTEG